MLFDTHCHLVEYGNTVHTTLSEARLVGIEYFLSVSARFSDWQKQFLIQKEKGVFTAFGIHPFYINELSDSLDLNTEWVRVFHHNPLAVVGEIGLDFYDKSLTKNQKDKQISLFTQQIIWATSSHRPIVLHQRKAMSSLIPILKRYHIRGFAHGFSGSLEEARQLLDCGLIIGIGSVLLRQNARKIRETLQYLPSDGFVLETDAPFMLAEQNFPKNITRIAQIVADIRQTRLADLHHQTTYNALNILKI